MVQRAKCQRCTAEHSTVIWRLGQIGNSPFCLPQLAMGKGIALGGTSQDPENSNSPSNFNRARRFEDGDAGDRAD